MKQHSLFVGLAALALVSGTIAPATAQETAAPDFGTNTSEWRDDGECDDARFVGDGMSDSLITDHIGRDAMDCQTAFGEDRISLNPYFEEPADTASINYGDNKSEFAYDGSCDDIRFTGSYSADMVYLVEDIGHDAADCEAAVSSGAARWQGGVADPNPGVTVTDPLPDNGNGTI